MESRAFTMESGEAQDGWARLWTVSVALFLALAVAGPLIFGLPVLSGFSGADSNFNLQLVQGYVGAVHAGHLFPRWLADANAGLGSPVFYFYGRLPFLVAACFAILLHVSASAGLLLGMGLFRLLTFFTCRAWLRQSAGSRAADCGALAFVAAPFAMMLNSIGRIGYAETAATALIPLLLLFSERISGNWRSAARHAACLALVYAALAATHLPQTLLAFMVAAVYAVLLRGMPALLANAAGAACGLLLSGPSVLPAVLMQRFITPIGWRGDPYVDIRNNFLFTLSRFHLYHFFAQELFLYSTWLLCLLILVLAASRPEWRQKLKRGRREQALLVVLSLCLLAMTKLFWPLWVYTPLRTVQFPWRLFPSGIALAAGLLAALVRTSGKQQRLVLGLLGLLVVSQFATEGTGFFFSHAPGQHFARHVPVVVTYRLPSYAPRGMRETPKYAQIRSFPPEYIPAGAHNAGWHVSSNQEQLVLGTRALAQPPQPPPGVREAQNSDGSIALRGSPAQPVSFLLPSFFFPDERIFGPVGALSLDPPSGLTRVALPAGSFSVLVAHAAPTPSVTLGRFASAIGAVLVALLFAVSFKRSASPAL